MELENIFYPSINNKESVKIKNQASLGYEAHGNRLFDQARSGKKYTFQ